MFTVHPLCIYSLVFGRNSLASIDLLLVGWLVSDSNCWVLVTALEPSFCKPSWCKMQVQISSTGGLRYDTELVFKRVTCNIPLLQRVRWKVFMFLLHTAFDANHFLSGFRHFTSIHNRGIASSDGGIWVKSKISQIKSTKSVHVNFSLGKNNVRTAIEHECWSFVPPQKYIPPKQIFGYAPDL